MARWRFTPPTAPASPMPRPPRVTPHFRPRRRRHAREVRHHPPVGVGPRTSFARERGIERRFPALPGAVAALPPARSATVAGTRSGPRPESAARRRTFDDDLALALAGNMCLPKRTCTAGRRGGRRTGLHGSGACRGYGTSVRSWTRTVGIQPAESWTDQGTCRRAACRRFAMDTIWIVPYTFPCRRYAAPTEASDRGRFFQH